MNTLTIYLKILLDKYIIKYHVKLSREINWQVSQDSE